MSEGLTHDNPAYLRSWFKVQRSLGVVGKVVTSCYYINGPAPVAGGNDV